MLPFLLAAAMNASPALIVNHAGAAAGGYAISIAPSGAASLTRENEVTSVALDRSTVSTFFARLNAAEPLDRLTVKNCAKTMGSTGRITVTYGGATTPGDLSCGGDSRAAALMESVRAIAKEAGIVPKTMRMIPN